MTNEDKLYADKLRNKAISDYERLNLAINELEATEQARGMTREQAYNYLKSSGMTDEQIKSVIDAFTCEDCISRQAAIDLADELKDDLPDDDRLSDMVMSHNEGILEYQTKLSLLPSVTPKFTDTEIQKMQELEQAQLEKAYELGKAEVQPCEDAVSKHAVLETIDSRIEQIKRDADAINKSYSHLSYAEGVYNGYCRLKCDLWGLPSVTLLAEPCEDCISRQALLDKIERPMNWTDSEAELQEQRDYEGFIELVKSMPSVTPKTEWIPVAERLPEQDKTGCGNWHTDICIVCMYGKGVYDNKPEEEKYEILTGYFIEMEDLETKETQLCFEPDRFTLFIPDKWDFFPLDKEFKAHLPKDECMYYTDDSGMEFHDRYYQVLAWMPLPTPYKS